VRVYVGSLLDNLPHGRIDDRLQDPNFLAHKTNQIRQEQPGLLDKLFGTSGPSWP
jgi:hypothetical protein